MGLFNTAVMLNYNFENFEEKKLCESMERIALLDLFQENNLKKKLWQMNNQSTKV